MREAQEHFSMPAPLQSSLKRFVMQIRFFFVCLLLLLRHVKTFFFSTKLKTQKNKLDGGFGVKSFSRT
jgi:hypothetical protein